MKNVIKNKNFWFPQKLYETRKKISRRNYSSQEDIQIYFRALFVRTRTFRFNYKKLYQK